MTGGSNKRVSLAALIAIKPGCQPRLIYRVHKNRRRVKDQRKGFTETGYAQLLDAAHQQLAGPLVVVWDYVARHITPRDLGNLERLQALLLERHRIQRRHAGLRRPSPDDPQPDSIHPAFLPLRNEGATLRPAVTP